MCQINQKNQSNSIFFCFISLPVWNARPLQLVANRVQQSIPTNQPTNPPPSHLHLQVIFWDHRKKAYNQTSVSHQPATPPPSQPPIRPYLQVIFRDHWNKAYQPNQRNRAYQPLTNHPATCTFKLCFGITETNHTNQIKETEHTNQQPSHPYLKLYFWIIETSWQSSLIELICDIYFLSLGIYNSVT